jgi:hypothetical protein
VQTIAYGDLEKRFQSISGLATLDATDKFFFKQSLNSRLRDAWDRADWPDLIELKTLPLSRDSSNVLSTGQVDFDVLEVWDKHPYGDNTAQKILYQIVESDVLMRPNYSGTEVVVLAKKKFIDYDEDSLVPSFLENYLISAILSDFFKGDGQADRAIREENQAEEYMSRAFDRIERLQQQNRPTIGQYSPTNPQKIYQSI